MDNQDHQQRGRGLNSWPHDPCRPQIDTSARVYLLLLSAQLILQLLDLWPLQLHLVSAVLAQTPAAVLQLPHAQLVLRSHLPLQPLRLNTRHASNKQDSTSDVIHEEHSSHMTSISAWASAFSLFSRSDRVFCNCCSRTSYSISWNTSLFMNNLSDVRIFSMNSEQKRDVWRPSSWWELLSVDLFFSTPQPAPACDSAPSVSTVQTSNMISDRTHNYCWLIASDALSPDYQTNLPASLSTSPAPALPCTPESLEVASERPHPPEPEELPPSAPPAWQTLPIMPLLTQHQSVSWCRDLQTLHLWWFRDDDILSVHQTQIFKNSHVWKFS